MITIKDIADEIGVSTAIVSIVLSGRSAANKRASPELAKKIKAVAAEFGYTPNVSARALSKKRQNTICMLASRKTGQAESTDASATLFGVSKVLSANSFRTVLQYFETEEEFTGCIGNLRRQFMDGVVVDPGWIFNPEKYRDSIEQKGLPTLFFLQNAAENIFDIGINHDEVSTVATEHLVARGCKKIAFLDTGGAAGQLRLEGYQKAIANAGMQFDKRMICHLSGKDKYKPAIADRGIGKMIEAGVRFDGIVAASDGQAFVLLHKLQSLGIKVPEEVKIIGVDNSPICELSFVKISSVSGQPELRGEIAARKLLHRIAPEEFDGNAAGKITNIPPKVVARESTLKN